jgi:hypothetical protein
MRVDSKNLDGLRRFAAFHVALGHCFAFATNTEMMGECRPTHYPLNVRLLDEVFPI